MPAREQMHEPTSLGLLVTVPLQKQDFIRGQESGSLRNQNTRDA